MNRRTPRMLLPWTILLLLILGAGAHVGFYRGQECPTCLRHERETGHIVRSLALTTHGCVLWGWTGCPDCHGRMKVTPLRSRQLQRAVP
ncbi:MAG: hypothetical protein HY293_07360 [Planctomycetes bacterium]|nr:hypothetical protein [Planctomycetota bacterium]